MLLLKSLSPSIGNKPQPQPPSPVSGSTPPPLRPPPATAMPNNAASQFRTVDIEDFDSKQPPPITVLPSHENIPPHQCHNNRAPLSPPAVMPSVSSVNSVPSPSRSQAADDVAISDSNSMTFKRPATVVGSEQNLHKQEWMRIWSSDELPEPRSGHTAVVAEQMGQMFMFGGYSNRRWFNDLWKLDLRTWMWTKIDVPDPKPRERLAHSMSIRGNSKIYVFGGWDEHDFQMNDLWEFDIELQRWREIVPGPESSTHDIPCPRFRHISAFSERKQRLYIFGGYNWVQHSMFNDMYEFNVETETWKRIKMHQRIQQELAQQGITNPRDFVICPRERHASAIDDENGKLYIMGGFGGFHSSMSVNRKFLNDLWEFDLENYSWQQIRCRGDVPRGVRSHTLSLHSDSHPRRLILFGGRGNDDNDTNDCYECDLETFTWKKLTNIDRGGNTPCARGRHTAVVCSGDCIVFGGTHSRTWFNDTFVCSFGTYRKDLMALWQG